MNSESKNIIGIPMDVHIALTRLPRFYLYDFNLLSNDIMDMIFDRIENGYPSNRIPAILAIL